MKSATPFDLACRSFEKHREVRKSYNHYTGIVSLHGFARLATETGSAQLLAEAEAQLAPYIAGERQFPVNFPNYLCGGNATAWLFYKGRVPHAEAPLRHYAEQILHEAPRDSDGILCRPIDPQEEKIWIDVAFAVTPFLLFTGLALGNEAYVNEGFEQTRKMVEVFKNKDNGLLHQSRGFNGRGKLSEDHWSRGNGWGIYALTELAAHLPEGHKHKAVSLKLYRDLIDAALKVRVTEEGLWRQEMSDIVEQTPRFSYVETSGSALFLYAIGVGLRHGLLEGQHYHDAFFHGLRGLLAYISDDTDIYHTCRGCLCPGNGTLLDYRAVPPVVNDCHAFGPVTLAMGQAHLLGIQHLERL